MYRYAHRRLMCRVYLEQKKVQDSKKNKFIASKFKSRGLGIAFITLIMCYMYSFVSICLTYKVWTAYKYV